MRLLRRFAALFRLRQIDDDLRDELEFHREMAQRELTNSGLALTSSASPSSTRHCCGICPVGNQSVWSSRPSLTNEWIDRPASPAEFEVWRRDVLAFDGIAASAGGTMNVSEPDRAAERLRGGYLSANAYRMLGAPPLIGRDFDASDDRPGAPAVVLLSFALWQARYGGDPDVIGRSLRINNTPATIVGVMPAGIAYPFMTEMWLPLGSRPGYDPSSQARSLNVFGRLRPDASRVAAQAELAAARAEGASSPADRALTLQVV